MKLLIISLLLSVTSFAKDYSEARWGINYSKGVSTKPFRSGEGFWFPFPGPGGHVNYVQMRDRIRLPRNARAVTVVCRITGSPDLTFSADTGGPEDVGNEPPSVRVMLQSNLYAVPHGRWWSRQGIELALGVHVLRVPLRPGYWSNVLGGLGENHRKKFRQHLRRPQTIGFTFGGGLDFGHGVFRTRGHGDFRLLSYRVR